MLGQLFRREHITFRRSIACIGVIVVVDVDDQLTFYFDCVTARIVKVDASTKASRGRLAGRIENCV